MKNLRNLVAETNKCTIWATSVAKSIRSLTAFVVLAALFAPVAVHAIDGKKWERLEIVLNNPSYGGNPFEVEVDATFTHSSGTKIKMPGYYAGSSKWKVAFMPTKTGSWSYKTSSRDGDLNGKSGSISVSASGLPGMLKGDSKNRKKWRYTDGPYVQPIGMLYSVFLENGSNSDFNKAANFLKDNNFQLFNFRLTDRAFTGNYREHKFDLSLWDRLDDRMEILTRKGLGVSVMIYTDDSGKPNWGPRSETEQLLIRYMVARLAAYPVVMFNSGIDIKEYRDGGWIQWYGDQVRALDPYDHPVSSRINDGDGYTAMSKRNFDSVGNPGAEIRPLISLFNRSGNMPAAVDDNWGEQQKRFSYGTPDDIRRAFWKCFIAGGIASHIRDDVKSDFSGANDPDFWFHTNSMASKLDSEQWVRLINEFIQDELGETFGEMEPNSSLVSNGYALADPGKTTMAFFLMGKGDKFDSGNGQAVTIKLGGLSGNYTAKWFDTRSGRMSNAGTLSGGSSHSLDPPSDKDWILYVTKGGSASPPSINIETSSSLPSGEQGDGYSTTLSASGGSGGLSWAVVNNVLPRGLSLSAAGRISGTPTESGNFNPTIRVKDNAGKTDSKQFSLKIEASVAPLSVTTSSLSSGKVGKNYSATMRASGGESPYRWSITSGSLPSGLSLNASSGQISGTPRAAGNRTITARVTDDNSRSASKSLKITITADDPPPPPPPAQLSISTSSLPGATVGQNYSATLSAKDGSGSKTWSIANGRLPSGLNLSAGGRITGKPTATGNQSPTFRVRDSSGSATRQITIRVTAEPAPRDPSSSPMTINTRSLPGGKVGSAYRATFSVEGGSGSKKYRVSRGRIPAGLSFGASDGVLKGTPRSAGTRSFMLEAKDSKGQFVRREFSVSIGSNGGGNPPTANSPSITTASLSAATVGKNYSQRLRGQGGATPYAWTLASAIPSGLSLNKSTGVISGKPTKTQVMSVKFRVTDRNGKAATRSLTISVRSDSSDSGGGSSGQLSVGPTSLPRAVAGETYKVYLKGSGGSGPYTWTIIDGAMPGGLYINGSTGTLKGITKWKATTSSFKVRVKDSNGKTGTRSYTISVVKP